jgi:hypothetical protein
MTETRTVGAVPTVGSLEEALTWVGRARTRGGPPPVVEATTSRFYAAVLEDRNPDWWERDLCPPGLLMSFGLSLPWQPGDAEFVRPLVFEIPLPGPSLMGSTIDTRLHRPFEVGERVLLTETLASISDEKETRWGWGHWVTVQWTYRNQDGIVCAEDEVVSLRFHPRRAEGDLGG